MTFGRFRHRKHCRWCQTQYYASVPINGDGFCCAGHKQAHYRAYKKWVTGKAPGAKKEHGTTRARK